MITLSYWEEEFSGRFGRSVSGAGTSFMRNRIAAVVVLISVIISSVLCCGCSRKGPVPYIDLDQPIYIGEYGGEKIEWIVLDVKDGKALLLSKYVIDARPFNTRDRKISWKLCSLRTWLNVDFYMDAFTTGEKSLILKTDLPGEDDVTDRIFLLSEQEMGQYFPYEGEERNAYPTRYAMDQGAEMYIDGTTEWWLRTTGYRENLSLVVSTFSNRDENVKLDYYGVRPAMWISLED